MVPEVLGLNDMGLGVGGIHTTASDSTSKETENVTRATCRKDRIITRDKFRSLRDQVEHRRTVVFLDIRTKKLTTLTETNSIETIAKFRYIVQLSVHNFQLLPNISKPASSLVGVQGILDVNTMDQKAMMNVLDEMTELLHANGMPRISHAVP